MSLLQILDAGVRGVGHVEAVDRLTLAEVIVIEVHLRPDLFGR